jgi:hypothetical protein
MPKYAPSKLPSAVKKRYFELLREGHKVGPLSPGWSGSPPAAVRLVQC